MDSGTTGEIVGRVATGALVAATGRSWSEWFAQLDDVGAADWGHKRIVEQLLDGSRPVASGWWAQTIAVGYEQARGKRVVGQTADAGFQLGVQRTAVSPPERVWNVIVSRPDLWLGSGAPPAFNEGEHYEVPGSHELPAASGEVRVVRSGDRLRMTWQPHAWDAPATLQLALSVASSGRTSVRAHLEKLPDSDAREAMRTQWRASLERIVAEADGAREAGR